PRLDTVERVLCPPFISLTATKELIKGSSVKLGAQNMYFKDKGAYTGEISPPMLSDLCDFVILGHSERRQLFGETDDMVNSKVKAAYEFGLKPILCVGESLADNETNRTEAIVASQIRAALSGVAATDQLVVAYEPIWAIGTGKAATGKQASATISLIRSTIAQLWGESPSQAIRILYGGSVTGDNIAEFISEPEIDGALVGGASLKADDFASIVRQTASIKSAS
ncbi:MAG: triose-phosphate isomerase, partial [Chloroflexi bacterium]|nr:triose-phosphate isomerase [Chloroflexota bacterium]